MGGFMGKSAFRAALDVLRFADVLEISAATVPQQVERTITKQAVEGFRIAIIVARKIPTFFISKELITVFHCRGHRESGIGHRE